MLVVAEAKLEVDGKEIAFPPFETPVGTEGVVEIPKSERLDRPVGISVLVEAGPLDGNYVATVSAYIEKRVVATAREEFRKGTAAELKPMGCGGQLE